jgi:hypothetical protein
LYLPGNISGSQGIIVPTTALAAGATPVPLQIYGGDQVASNFETRILQPTLKVAFW